MNHISGALPLKNTRITQADAAVKRFYLYIYFFKFGGPNGHLLQTVLRDAITTPD